MSKNKKSAEINSKLLEDSMDISEETKRDVAIARKEIREGKTVSLEEVKKRLDL